MLKDFLIGSCFVVLLVVSAYCAADSIVVYGTTYTDVYVTEGPSMYYVCIPTDGTIINVDKAALKEGDLAISEDSAQRLTLKTQFDKNRALIKAHIERQALKEQEARDKALQDKVKAREEEEARQAEARHQEEAKQAEENAAREKANREQETAKAAPQKELGIWDGFRGIRWGAEEKDLLKAGFSESSPQRYSTDVLDPLSISWRGAKCKRDGEKLQMGNASLKGIEYVIVDGKFQGVYLTAQGGTDCRALRDVLLLRYGKPLDHFLDPSKGVLGNHFPDFERFRWKGWDSSGKQVEIELSINYEGLASGWCDFVCHTHIEKEENELKERESERKREKLQRGAKEDF
jgi:hypothetical protein